MADESTHYICSTCGTQFSASAQPPSTCPICADERQYIGAGGQAWTTLERLRRGHRNAYAEIEPGLMGIGTMPEFAIGQRALLVRTREGNYLWDCIALLDAATIAIVNALGGLRGIAISHPHYYTTMVEWSRAFGDAPIYLHAGDREWVMRDDPAIRYWEGERKTLADGLTLVRCGGHFTGGTVLHWAHAADGRGALLSGDIVQVVFDRRFVSFMRSYPNLVPLPASEVTRIAATLTPFAFDRVYGAWWDRHVEKDGKAAVMASAERYVRALAEPAS